MQENSSNKAPKRKKQIGLTDFLSKNDGKTKRNEKREIKKEIKKTEAPTREERESSGIKENQTFKNAQEWEGPWFLLSTDYDRASNKALLKFYNQEEHRIEYRLDPTGHEPYFISDLPIEQAEQNQNILKATKRTPPRMEEIEKFYPLKDDEHLIKMLKIYTKTPIDVRDARTTVPTAWEARIRYHRNWIFDTQTVPGLLYHYSNKGLKPAQELKSRGGSRIAMSPEVREILKSYNNLLMEYMPAFTTPIPRLLTAGIDIETGGPPDRIPTPRRAQDPIICICLVGTNDTHYAFVLDISNDEESKENYRARWGLRPEDLPKELSIKKFHDEKELLLAFFTVLLQYPVIVGFNSDNFDFAYLYYRAQKLGIPRDDIPIEYDAKNKKAILRGAIHLDLYRWYHNASIKGYAHGGSYKQDDLDTIARALLNAGKVELKQDIRDLPLFELIFYCWRDTTLTLNLFTFDDYTPVTLMIILSRITRMPLEDLIRTSISNWIQNMFFFEHRRRNMLIPTREEIQAKGTKASKKAIIKDKKFMGALVVEPVPGVHFNVTVLDFACFSSDTEILTEDGWTSFSGLKNNLRVATINQETQDVEFQPIEEVFKYDYEGKMISFKQ
ncbi:MAG: 3'-5' exonuclease, partial [Promethearchaeota archaeon]